MNTEENAGQAMHSDDAEARREAARMMGRARTEKKIAAARAVAESRRGVKWTEEQKAKLRTAQAERRERERLAKEAAGESVPVKEKKAVGRPRTRLVENATEKRPVGRPKKQTGQTTLETE